MLELESQRDVLLRENDDLKAKAERLVGDNVTLFEKIKWVFLPGKSSCSCVKRHVYVL